eukprot:2997278-Rhodomonas_salina.1
MPLPLCMHMNDDNRTDFILCLIPQQLHHDCVRTVLLNLSMTGRHDPRGGGCDTPVSQSPGIIKIPDFKLSVN